MGITITTNIIDYLRACYDAPRRAGMWEFPQGQEDEE